MTNKIIGVYFHEIDCTINIHTPAYIAKSQTIHNYTSRKHFAKNEPFEHGEYDNGEVPEKTANAPCSANFEPYKGKIRKAGTGGIYQISDTLFEGRYSPTNAHGKREVHTVYAKTREECEKLLEEMIPKVRAEIKAEKDRLKEEQNQLT